jgi:hypothetical protein
MKMKRLVLLAALGAVLLDTGAALAGPAPRPIPNPDTLLLFTTGLGGLAWWLKKGK